MPSQIDATRPVEGSPTTQSVRDNFATASTEITTLQDAVVGHPFMPLAGGQFTGPVYLNNDPTDAMMPATKGYVDAHGGGSGGGGIPDAPATGVTFGRNSGAWRQVLDITGGTLSGPLTLAGDPAGPLQPATRQYVDAATAPLVPDAPSDGALYSRRSGAWQSAWSTGDVKITIKTTPDPGWIFFDDGAIGDANSAASSRANADTQALFTLLWTATTNANCPVLPGGRGTSAAADFAAHKTIALPKVLGRALAAAGSGASLTPRVLGSILGEETHTLSAPEMPVHNHNYTDNGHTHSGGSSTGFQFADCNTNGNGPVPWNWGGAYMGAGYPTISTNATGISIQNAGGSAGHNNMQPTSFFNIMCKL